MLSFIKFCENNFVLNELIGYVDFIDVKIFFVVIDMLKYVRFFFMIF